MMVTAHTEKLPLSAPTQAELMKMWGLMVKAVEKREGSALAEAKRMIMYGRRDTPKDTS